MNGEAENQAQIPHTITQDRGWNILPSFMASSIRNRLVVILIAFTVIPVLLVGLTSGPLSVRTTNNQIRDTLTATGSLKEIQVNIWIEDLYQELALQYDNRYQPLTSILRLEPGSNTYRSLLLRQRTDMQTALENNNFLDELFVLDFTGEVILSSEPTQEGKSFARSAFFQRGLSGPVIQPATYELSRQGHSIYIAQPVIHITGEVAGVLAARADLIRIEEIMLERSGLGDTGETYLVTPNFALLTQARDTTYATENTFVRSEGAQRAVDQNQVGTANYINYEGEEVIGNYRWIPELQLALLTEQHESEALAPLRDTTNLLIAATLISIILASFAAFYFSQSLAGPLTDLTYTAEQIAGGNLELQVKTDRQDEIGALGFSFNRMTMQLRNLITNLEEAVQNRTLELEQRSDQLKAATDVGRSVATILDTEQLIQQVVELIQGRFNLYYVGLFLVDENRDWAVLKAGTGRAGQAMLARDHKLRVGEGSMIGWSVSNAQARIALEAGEDPVRLATPDLPETRSEAAIPLRSRGQVLGALTVQDRRPNAFDAETIAVFQVMADQVAVALDNAKLFYETQQALEASQQVFGQLSRRAWLERLRERAPGYRRSPSGLAHVAENLAASPGDNGSHVLQSTEAPGGGNIGEAGLVVPIRTRGQTIGFIRAQKPESHEGAQSWSSDEVGLLENLIDQLGVALDSARLFESTQQQAEHQRLVGEITSRMRATPDIDAVLQTAVRELRNALDLDEVEVRLGEITPTPEGDNQDQKYINDASGE